jgi:hypothetical protein
MLLLVGSRVGFRTGGMARKTSFSAPVLAPAHHRRQQNAPTKRHAQHCHWFSFKMLLPIGNRLYLPLQLIQVGT